MTKRVISYRHKFSASDQLLMRAQFEVYSFPDMTELSSLAVLLGCTSRRVQVWFQNRRQRRHRASPEDLLHKNFLLSDAAFIASATKQRPAGRCPPMLFTDSRSPWPTHASPVTDEDACFQQECRPDPERSIA